MNMLALAEVDLTPWVQFGAIGLLGAILLVVGPRILDKMLAEHRKALEDLSLSNREANTRIVSELRAMTLELRTVWERLNNNSNQVMRLVVTLASGHPELAKEIAATLDFVKSEHV